MNHRMHRLCLIAALAMLAVLMIGSSSSIGLGVGLLLLVCPIVMGTMMWFLMRPTTPRQETVQVPVPQDFSSRNGPTR